MNRLLGWKGAILVVLLLFFVTAQSPDAASTLSPGDMLEDLEFLETTLRQVHPEPFQGKGVDSFVRSFAQVRPFVDEPLSVEAFYYHALGLTAQLSDMNTRVYLEDESKELPLRFWWTEDSLVVAGATAQAGLPRGSIVERIGTATPAELLEWAEAQLPTENSWGLATAVAGMLHSGGFLRQLGLVSDEWVEMVVRTPTGERLTKEVLLQVPVTVPTAMPSRPHFGWYIVDEEDIAVLYLDWVEDLDEYKPELARFFRAVMEHGIEDIVLDLRWNATSNVDSIAEFLRFFPEQRIEGYAGEIRYSQQAAAQRGYEETMGVERVSHLTRLFGGYTMNLPARPPDLEPYAGNLYLLSSPMTARAAHWFAVVVSDNDLGFVVGEPTGQRPSGYGDALEFRLPNSRLRLSVSHKKFIRPDPNRDPAESLLPDWPLPITADYLTATDDFQLQELLQKIRLERGTP